MGHVYSAYIGSPETAPVYTGPGTFDPMYGFPNGRKQRVAKATEEEMEAAGIEPQFRDYCAHHLIDFLKCEKEYYPFVAVCKPEKHVWENCQFDDYVMRMKEYERERRLLERAKRKGELQAHKEAQSQPA